MIQYAYEFLWTAKVAIPRGGDEMSKWSSVRAKLQRDMVLAHAQTILQLRVNKDSSGTAEDVAMAVVQKVLMEDAASGSAAANGSVASRLAAFSSDRDVIMGLVAFTRAHDWAMPIQFHPCLADMIASIKSTLQGHVISRLEEFVAAVRKVVGHAIKPEWITFASLIYDVCAMDDKVEVSHVSSGIFSTVADAESFLSNRASLTIDVFVAFKTKVLATCGVTANVTYLVESKVSKLDELVRCDNSVHWEDWGKIWVEVLRESLQAGIVDDAAKPEGGAAEGKDKVDAVEAEEVKDDKQEWQEPPMQITLASHRRSFMAAEDSTNPVVLQQFMRQVKTDMHEDLLLTCNPMLMKPCDRGLGGVIIDDPYKDKPQLFTTPSANAALTLNFVGKLTTDSQKGGLHLTTVFDTDIFVVPDGAGSFGCDCLVPAWMAPEAPKSGDQPPTMELHCRKETYSFKYSKGMNDMEEKATLTIYYLQLKKDIVDSAAQVALTRARFKESAVQSTSAGAVASAVVPRFKAKAGGVKVNHAASAADKKMCPHMFK